MVQKLIRFITWPWRKWKEEREFKKRLKELRKKDPFIYK
tara:strand:- start:1218 stop:1334 length:117 start_codon:yes stop_codon:yes gene_type:complete